MSVNYLETKSEANPDMTVGESLALRRGQRLQAALELGGDAVNMYFHGTHFPLEPGDEVRPGEQAIVDEDGVRHASASVYEDGAWFYALSREGPNGGRGRVYRVIPSDGSPVKQIGPQFGEVNSPSFTVVDQIDTAPGRQGTLPGINWNKGTPYSTLNHPEDPPPTIPNDFREFPNISPDEVPLAGLDDRYVSDELERQRIAAGIPQI
ncbi:hypothetical protein KDA23_01705 [Candidatus Saccharibacteria bacterium]|nr:hypothetical protein [Candidatus Saccharibacteria bacterium]